MSDDCLAKARGLVKELEDRLYELSELVEELGLDSLTKLPNRGALEAEVQRSLSRWCRDEAPITHGSALVLIDLDHFKRVNDTCGHAAGDEVLRKVAATLKNAVRDGDLAARFGGEEFAVLLHNTPREGAHEFADRLRAKVKLSAGVTFSAGVATFHQVGLKKSHRQSDELFKMADEALYRAKDAGRDRVEVA